MRNMWIGMIIGAATGAAIGATADGSRRAREVAVETGHTLTHALKEHTPEALATAKLASRRIRLQGDDVDSEP